MPKIAHVPIDLALQRPARESLLTAKKSWLRFLRIAFMHLGCLAAPFYFSWSGLILAAIGFQLTGFGVTIGLHRFLTHRSFKTSQFLGRIMATLGALAYQGGVIEWVALHRIHHKHSDKQGDPHTPTKGFWFGHFLWTLFYDERVLDPASRSLYVPDLMQDPYLRFLDRFPTVLQIALATALYIAGNFVEPGLGISWVVYGIFVRFVVVQHVTWLVNSAGHTWGYKNFDNRDESTNCWWVALLALGEGWHNNHHAKPSSANFGYLWYEVDSAFSVIRTLQRCGLVWDVKDHFKDLTDASASSSNS